MNKFLYMDFVVESRLSKCVVDFQHYATLDKKKVGEEIVGFVSQPSVVVTQKLLTSSNYFMF